MPYPVESDLMSKKADQPEDHIMEVGENPPKTPAKIMEEGGDSPEPVVDYAGSAAKTDPEEIRLVKKLDLVMLASVSKMAVLELLRQFH